MNRWGRWLERLFFYPGNGYELGVTRFLYYLLLFWTTRTYPAAAYGHLPDDLWMPSSIFWLLGLSPPFPEPWLTATIWLWRASLITSALGLFTRFSTGLAFVTSLFVMGLHQGFNQYVFDLWQPVVVMGVLALSDCGHYFSLDRLLRRPGRQLDEDWKSPNYRWPVRTVQLITLIFFFNAGLSKWRNSGFQWADNAIWPLAFVSHYHYPKFDWQVQIRNFALNHRSLAVAAAWLILILETAAILAFFSRRAERILVPAQFILTVFFLFVFYVYSLDRVLISFLFWVPWARLLPGLMPAEPRADPATGTEPAGTNPPE